MDILGLDLFIWIFLIMFLSPIVVVVWELMERRKYPIKAEVTYEAGSSTPQGKTNESYEDSVGLRPVKKDGKFTGTKEWRFRGSQKTVQKFSYANVGRKRGLFGMKYLYTRIMAVSGEKGEEFYPMAFDTGTKGFKPIFDSDRTVASFRLREAIRERNKMESWLQQHAFQLAIGGIALAITIMLFINFLQLTEISKNFSSAAGAWQAASVKYENYTETLVAKNKTVPNIGGIPFGFGVGG